MLDWGKGNLTYQPETISDHFINKMCLAVGTKDVEAMMWKLKIYQRKFLEKLQDMLQYLETNEEFYKHKRRHGKKCRNISLSFEMLKSLRKYTQKIEKENST